MFSGTLAKVLPILGFWEQRPGTSPERQRARAHPDIGEAPLLPLLRGGSQSLKVPL